MVGFLIVFFMFVVFSECLATHHRLLPYNNLVLLCGDLLAGGQVLIVCWFLRVDEYLLLWCLACLIFLSTLCLILATCKTWDVFVIFSLVKEKLGCGFSVSSLFAWSCISFSIWLFSIVFY